MQRSVLFIILIVFILIIGVIVGTYFFAVRNDTDAPLDTIRGFLPFGGGGVDRDVTPPTFEDNISEVPDVIAADIPPPKLRQLHDKPVSGIGVFGDSATSTIRFVERETGHVFEIGEEEAVSRRITNTTIPRIQEALFATKDSVLIRYLADDSETLQTFAAQIMPAVLGEGEGELTGTFFPQNAESAATFGDLVFYTVYDEGRGYVSR